MSSIRVQFAQCDFLEAFKEGTSWQLRATGCSQVLDLIRRLHEGSGTDISSWPLPAGIEHADMLVRELILKAQGQWQYPYLHEELCHCRTIATQKVDQAILMGAHRPEVVSRQTSAATACGTCRPDIEKIIEYRLGQK